MELRHELRNAYEWYLLESRRRRSPLSARNQQRHEEILNHYGRQYLRRLIIGVSGQQLFDRFHSNVEALAARIVGLDQLLARCVLKPSPGLGRFLSE